MALILAAAGTALATVAGASVLGHGAGTSMLIAPLIAVAAVLGRWYDSRKPPLPLHLMTPQPTPAGDASALLVAGYQVDALLLVAVVGGFSAALLG